ncbi:MAG: carboxypeptidase regulatory-like domain-containing protein [Acidobacteria bacterium]|nr:carboxypeptidase regulatory-like domain-containing protein [Acidobacteriota bacterium]
MKSRLLLIIGLVMAGLALGSWRAGLLIFSQDAPPRVYNSPVGSFTLPTVEGTAGMLGSDYKLATLEFGFASNVPQVGDLAGDTGNGFSDRYDFENLNAFSIPQSANEIGDLDSLNPSNRVIVGGRFINPGFRFVHIGRQAFIWRVGGDDNTVLAREVTVFPSVDHLFDPEVPGYGPRMANPPIGGFGNIALEALEFTVWGTNDRAEAEVAARTPEYFGRGGTGVLPNNKWFRATLSKVFAEGFKDYNGRSPFAAAGNNTDPSPQEGDDFASRWQFRDGSGAPVGVKFVAVYANRTRDAAFFQPDQNGNIPGNTAQSNECEIDAVAFVDFTAPPTATISGRVINDANANGRIDAQETPIPGVTVKLSGGAGVNLDTTTNQNGEYSFTQVVPGDYRVTEVNLPGFVDTGVLPGAGNTAIDLNNIGATLSAGEVSVENNFLDAIPPADCVPACYNNVDMWLLFDSARQAVYDRLGGVGGIFILSLNRGAQSDDEVIAALSAMESARDRLGAQFVGAQLNAASFPLSVFNRASCFFNGPNVIVRIPGDPRLIDLLNQARTIFNTGNDVEIDTLAVYIELINNVTATRGIICPFADP